MARVASWVEKIDRMLVRWMASHGVALLRLSLGLVFLWFGAIKFVPGLSPAAELATGTISELTGGFVTPNVSLPLLAAWECLIGLGLMTGRWLRFTLLLLFLQMPGTLAPLLLSPESTFTQAPFGPTLEGQYIVKNFVLISAGIVVGATVRGGHLTASPEREEA
ncbi:MAG TPA: hypothetical protein PLH94_08850 [Fimbriimonadaceae bacterium]|nr:hypothetical protein [Fimbriimonadaceae bacterium]